MRAWLRYVSRTTISLVHSSEHVYIYTIAAVNRCARSRIYVSRYHEKTIRRATRNPRSRRATARDTRQTTFVLAGIPSSPDRISVAETVHAAPSEMRETARGGGVGREKGRHFVRGQRSLEFHTWINSPASRVRSTSSSSSGFLSFLPRSALPSPLPRLRRPRKALLREFRDPPCAAANERPRELRQPPPCLPPSPSSCSSRPPPTPRQYRTRECMTTSTWPMKSGTLAGRCGRRGVIFAR